MAYITAMRRCRLFTLMLSSHWGKLVASRKSQEWFETRLVHPIMPAMKPDADGAKRGYFLGIEAGGTRTVALLADDHGRAVRRLEAGPANLRLVTDSQLVAHL